MSFTKRYTYKRETGLKNRELRPKLKQTYGHNSSAPYRRGRNMWSTQAGPSHQLPMRSVIGLQPNPSPSQPVLQPIQQTLRSIQSRPQEAEPMLFPASRPPSNQLLPSTPTMVRPPPDVKRIVDVYQRTLGRVPHMYDSEDMILLPFNTSQTSLSQVYGQHIDEVTQFCQSLDLISSLPQNEFEENHKNWLEVLVLRSCWWFTYIDEDDLDVLRVGDRYGLHRNSDKALEQLFMFAETIINMSLRAGELALITTYLLLMGTSSFKKSAEEQQSMTARRRQHVLKLFYNYEKEHYPDDPPRYVRLLTYLSELTYIARSI